MSLRESLHRGLNAAKVAEQDQPLADLALTYADSLDDTKGECETCGRHGGDLSKLGPALLVALEALHMSPRARAAVKKAVTDDKPAANPLDQLSERRSRRGRTEDLDPAATGSQRP